ncbi:thermonuclease family protein [Lentisphaerota bacterium WC36G]|nr:thermonuclease family protein [Lentisphaerae bacterium WC36]
MKTKKFNFIFCFIFIFFNVFCSCDNQSVLNQKSTKKEIKPITLPPVEAIVSYVYDGDSFKAKSHGVDIKVRLFGIDAPEKNQPYGKESLNNLIKLIKYKKVILEPIETDRYGRMIAKVYTVKKVDKKEVKTYINLEQLKSGLAWHYKRYAKNEKDLANAEKAAKNNKLGLWKQSNPVNPETYRHRK